MTHSAGARSVSNDPEAAIPDTLSPSQIPTFIHRSATNLQHRGNGDNWDEAATQAPSAERRLSPAPVVRELTSTRCLWAISWRVNRPLSARATYSHSLIRC